MPLPDVGDALRFQYLTVGNDRFPAIDLVRQTTSGCSDGGPLSLQSRRPRRVSAAGTRAMLYSSNLRLPARPQQRLA